MKKIKLTILMLLGFASAWSNPQNLPNIILIFIDDQGYNDLGVFGSPLIKTPKIDAMAAAGAKFTDFYAADNICSSSRASIMTGSYFRRTGVNGVLWPDGEVGLSANEVTIADLLKRKSYATAAIGKWHIGHRNNQLPHYNGFDMYYGIPYSNDMWLDPFIPLADDILFRDGWDESQVNAMKPMTDRADLRAASKDLVPLLLNDEVIEMPVDQTTITRRFTDETLKFIAQNQDWPFFIYLAHTMPHIPLFASEDFLGTSERGLYGDVIEEIDFNVGRILDTLEMLGLDSNTLVVYTGDNGPWDLSNGRGGSADPLRGFKFQNWEGGQRVATVMQWKGTIPAGLVQDAVTSTIDLLPTFAGIAGIPLPTGEQSGGVDIIIDGIDILPMMTGEPGATRDIPFYYDLEAIRLDEWKYRSNNDALYNLADDIHEDNDLSGSNATKKTELTNLLNDFKAELETQRRPQGNANTTAPTEGCVNPAASNFDASAHRDDGSCILPRGCLDEGYTEYDADAWIHDQSMCQTAGVGEHAARVLLKGVKVSQRNISIAIKGTHRVVIRNLRGQILHSITGQGLAEYPIEHVLQHGANLVEVGVDKASISAKIIRL